MDGRLLGLCGAPNARDLGPVPTADGRSVRAGQLFRAGALGRLTGEDRERLDGLRLATVLDLRDASEIAVARPDALPEPSPRVVHLPVFDPEHPLFTYVSAVLAGGDTRAFGELRDEGTTAAMCAIYRWFVSGPASRPSFGAAVRLAADEASRPLLFHCSAGKDRTGWLTAILLEIVGVDRATILADFLATNRHVARLNEEILDRVRARAVDVDPAEVLPVLEVRGEYLDAAYDEVDRVYGSFDAYLRVGLGLDDEVFGRLRADLVE